MDSNSYTPCSNFIDLLNSQQDTVYELVDDSVEVSSSQFSVFSSQATQDETPAERKERRSWTPIDDVALISAWLNTSKDPVVANEQRAGAFWKRIAAYFDGKSQAGREKSSSQNETDVLKHAHEIFYNNHKKRFTFEHAWKELRNDEKWCELSSGKTQGNAKRRKCDESAQSSNSHAFETSTGEDEKATIRPPGVKASKGHGLVSLHFKNVQQLFVSWHMVMRQMQLTNISGSVQLLHRRVWKILSKELSIFFGNEYLRRPTPADLQRLLDIGEHHGFPGMIGSIDCMHWEWKNCLTAWKGQYSRGSRKPAIVLEAVASYDLWIWHAFFGPPGTLNDINVLDRSPVFDDIIKGHALQVTYSVNGREYQLAYYLTDGIYLK
uniref:Uncharacterized protein n=1 Tax=Brassica oleracea var. oleracea TaxID=109376 RepID=A0A0D3BB99_BRAOL